MIDAHRVVFHGIDSLDLDLTPHLSFDSDGGGTASFLNRESVHSEHYDGSFRRIHSYKYNEVLSPTFTFVKSNFSDFSETENRKILSWLTGSDKPGWIEIYKDDSNVLSYKLFGNFIETEVYKLGNGRVVGYVATFESASPYAYSRDFTYPEVYQTIDEIGSNDETNDYLTISGTDEFTITCNTDEYNKPVYPKVTVTFKGKNPYFPIDVNPLQENTYPMVPNVIYSWLEKYVLATKYVEGVTYYSDTKGTVANPQPTSTTEITNKKYYSEENKTHLYVNLNGTKHNGRYAVQPLDSDTEASDATLEYKYYYFPEDNAIKTTIATKVNDVFSYEWEPVTHIGMAVRIKNTYVLNGVPTTKEAIIAGGAMDEVVILNGTNKLVSGARGTAARIVGDHFNWEWIPLFYGDNMITVNGNCTIKFEWLEPRKVGSL